MNQQPKMLITGASGFTGQHACKHFLEAGFDITAVTRKNSIATMGIHTEYCNLTNKNDVQWVQPLRELQTSRRIRHFAAQ